STVILLSISALLLSFSFHYSHRDLHSFPTRRSSDLAFKDLHGEIRAAFLIRCNGTPDIALDATVNRRFRWSAKVVVCERLHDSQDRKSTRLNSSHVKISYAVFCLKKKNTKLKGLCLM